MSGSPSHHNLFLYGEDSALVDQVVPFLTEGIAEREAVVIVLDPRKTALIREALGPIAGRVASVDRDSYYTRPEDALAGYDARVRRYLRAGAPRVRVFGELPLCRTKTDSDTWILYEALLNPAFAHHPVTIVCGLDGREQPDEVIEGSWRTHPRSLNHDWSDNGHFHDPSDTVRALTPPPDDVSGLKAIPADGGRARCAGGCSPRWPRRRSPTTAPRSCSPRRARSSPTPTATAAACAQSARGGSATSSSARSPTTAPASTTRSPATSRRTPGTAAARACGSPGRRRGGSR